MTLSLPGLRQRLPGEQWLDTGTLMSSPGTDADGSGTSIGDVFVIESTARLMKILSDFGPEDRYATRLRRSDDHALPVGDHHVIRAARDGLCLG